MRIRDIERLERACTKAGFVVTGTRWEEKPHVNGRDPRMVFAGLDVTDPVSGYPLVVYSLDDLRARLAR